MIKHWICIVKVDTEKLPPEFNFSINSMVIDRIKREKINIESCWSGWGLPEETIKKIKKVWLYD